MRQMSEWHKMRFRSGISPLSEDADENVAAAHKFLARIISLENSDYALLLLKCVYYFLFFSYPDKNGTPSVSFESLRQRKGYFLIPKNPYPVFEKAANLGIKTSLRDKRGIKTEKISEAERVTLTFSDRKVLRGLIAFEEGAEKRFGLSEKALFKKMFPYFISADFSFIYGNSAFIEKHHYAGYGEDLASLCEKTNAVLSGVSMLYDIKTDYITGLTVRRSALKKGTRSFLFSVELGERKSEFVFAAKLGKKTVLRMLRRISEFSPAFIQRFLHEKDCGCRACFIADLKTVYKNRVYSVPFTETVLSFPVRSEEDFGDMLKIIGLVLSNLPAYSALLAALKSYKGPKEGI